MEITQHAKYTCYFCGKDSVRRQAVGIWKCRSCRKTLAGGAWVMKCVPFSYSLLEVLLPFDEPCCCDAFAIFPPIRC